MGQFFRAMLCGGFAEDGETEITIRDVENEVTFRHILEWIYTGVVQEDLEPQHLSDLLQASSKYCMDSLVKICECRLKDHVNVQTVAVIYSLACVCEAEQLRRFCSFYAGKMVIQLAESVTAENAPMLRELGEGCSLPEVLAECDKIEGPKSGSNTCSASATEARVTPPPRPSMGKHRPIPPKSPTLAPSPSASPGTE